MELKDDKIKNLFASKLNNFEPEVPASVWSGIDDLLSEQSIVGEVPVKAKKHTLRTTLFGIAVAASIGLGLFLALDKSTMPVPQGVASEELVPKEQALPKEKSSPSMKEEEKETIVVNINRERSALYAHSRISSEIIEAESNTTLSEDTENSDIEEIDNTVIESTVIDEGVIPDSEGNVDNKGEQSQEVKPDLRKGRVTTLAMNNDRPLPIVRKTNSSSDVSLALKTNTGFMSGSESGRGNPLLFSSNDRSSKFVSLLKEENKEYKMTHKQPVSVGITVAKSLGQDLSLETGLVFTYLSSKAKSNSKTDIKEEMEFGYLGIPLYLNYNFYTVGDLQFYASLGVMAQKDVYGKYKSEMSITKTLTLMEEEGSFTSVLSDPEPSYMRKNISQPHWQFSTHLTVGASYPIYQKLKVYTSIGGAYYFDANNEYPTVYSDRKFQLDLNLGLKFDF